MKHYEPIITQDDDSDSPMSSNMQTVWSLVPIGVIFFIMLFSASMYYFFTAFR